MELVIWYGNVISELSEASEIEIGKYVICVKWKDF